MSIKLMEYFNKTPRIGTLSTASIDGKWKGIRVYLKMIAYETSGEKLEEMRKVVVQRVDEEAAKAMHAVITFEIQEVRPFSDSGQGWENSI